MSRLLVSVRSSEEASHAILGGADLVDVKEPEHGALGAAHSTVLRETAVESAGRCPLSAALGELLDFPPHECGEELAGYSFAKIGLAGMLHRRDWRNQWRDALAMLPQGVRGVATAYADFHTTATPEPLEVLHVGHGLGCRVFLLDTYGKNAGDLFSHLLDDEIAALFQEATRLNVMTVLAGSLRLESLPRALALQPHFVAVRGGVCRDSRRGTISIELVRRWADACHAADEKSPV